MNEMLLINNNQNIFDRILFPFIPVIRTILLKEYIVSERTSECICVNVCIKYSVVNGADFKLLTFPLS